MKGKKRKFEFDELTGSFVKKEEIELGDAKSVDEIRESLRIELASIVRQVKRAKARAGEIKEMLAVLDEKVKQNKSGEISPR